jgi:hypothetical protein
MRLIIREVPRLEESRGFSRLTKRTLTWCYIVGNLIIIVKADDQIIDHADDHSLGKPTIIDQAKRSWDEPGLAHVTSKGIKRGR